MHIALKKVRNDLERYLPKGSEEQAVEIYDIVKDFFFRLPVGKEEKLRNDSLIDEVKRLNRRGADLLQRVHKLEAENKQLKAEIIKGDSIKKQTKEVK